MSDSFTLEALLESCGEHSGKVQDTLTALFQEYQGEEHPVSALNPDYVREVASFVELPSPYDSSGSLLSRGLRLNARLLRDYAQGFKRSLSFTQRRTLKSRHELKALLGSDWRSLYALLLEDVAGQVQEGTIPTEELRALNTLLQDNPLAVEMSEERLTVRNLHSFGEEGGIYKVTLVVPALSGRNTFEYCVKRYLSEGAFQNARNRYNVLEGKTDAVPRRIGSRFLYYENPDGRDTVLTKHRLSIEPFLGNGVTLDGKVKALQRMSEIVPPDALSIVRRQIVQEYKDALDLLAQLDDDVRTHYEGRTDCPLPHQDFAEVFVGKAFARLHKHWNKKAGKELAERVKLALADYCALLPELQESPVLTHGDFHRGNVIGGKIIDHERYAFGAFKSDLSRLLFGSDLRWEELTEVVKHVREKNKTQKYTKQDDYASLFAFFGFDALRLAPQLYAKAQKHPDALEEARVMLQMGLVHLASHPHARGTNLVPTLVELYQKIAPEIVQGIAEISGWEALFEEISHTGIVPYTTAVQRNPVSYVGQTVAHDLDGIHSAVRRLNRTRSRVGRFYDHYLAYPLRAIALAGLLGGLSYGGYTVAVEKRRQEEVKYLEQEVLKARVKNILNTGGNKGILTPYSVEQLHELNTLRTALLEHPSEKPYEERRKDYNRAGTEFSLPVWESYFTPVEYYAEKTGVDATLLKAMILASAWQNSNGYFTYDDEGNPALTPIQSLRYLHVPGQRPSSSQSASANVLSAAVRMKDLLAQHGDTGKALLGYYAGDNYFGKKSWRNYPAGCTEGGYWDMRHFEQARLQEEGKGCGLDVFHQATSFVEMTLGFQRLFTGNDTMRLNLDGT